MKRALRRFRDDEDRFLVRQGHALRLILGRLGAYRDGAQREPFADLPER
jgi:hypothetical protein